MRNTLGLVAAAAFVLGPVLAVLRIVPGLVGFVVFALGGVLALGVALASLIQAARGRGFGAGGAAALVVAIVFVGSAMRGAGVPRINDFTTDLGDPPAFRNAATLPANAGRDLAYPADFAAVQRECCADLAPVPLPVPPAAAFDRALGTAKSMPSWTITVTDPAGGTIEAIDTSRVFGFQDDIIIRIRPDGSGSKVDMRSKSRDGKGDLGTNAARIRAYTTALQKPAS